MTKEEFEAYRKGYIAGTKSIGDSVIRITNQFMQTAKDCWGEKEDDKD